MLNTQQLYSGFDTFGRVIPTVAHAAQIREIYRRIGQKLQPGTDEWLASAERRGQAFDSAEARDDLPLTGERDSHEYDELNRLYEACLHAGTISPAPEYQQLNGDSEGRAESTRARGSEFQKPMIHTPAELEEMFEEYKRGMGWDHAPDAVVRANFEYQLYCDSRLRGDS